MAYEKPIKIKEAIASIEDGDYVLPAIQREFVSLFARLRKLNLYILRLTPLRLPCPNQSLRPHPRRRRRACTFARGGLLRIYRISKVTPRSQS